MDEALIARFGLLLVRPGVLVVVAPPFGGTFAPASVKVGFTVLVALLLAPIVALPDAFGPMGIGAVVAREVVIGLSLGFGVRVLVAAAELAGYLAGFQIGFSYATVADPPTGARNGVLSSVYGLTTLIVVFATDAHHDLVRGLALSYEALPVGLGSVGGTLDRLVAQMLGIVFVVGTQLAAPVLVVLLLTELGVALMARAAPGLNLMAHNFSVRIVVGLLTLALTFRVVPVVVQGGIPALLRVSADLAAAFR